MKKDVADYRAQYLCSDRLSVLEDPYDGFNGFDYLNAHTLLFDAMQESFTRPAAHGLGRPAAIPVPGYKLTS